jgi:signal transduction histidine kinase
MDVLDVIDLLQVAAFLGAALAAAWLWHRQRTRPAAYLATAFAAVGGALLTATVVSATPAIEPWFTIGVVGGLALFPWASAAFAWSFAGSLPSWLRLAGVCVLALAAWAGTLTPLVGTDEPRTSAQAAFVATFLVLWSVLAAAMAVRLWRAGSRQRLVRARMRLMATGAVLLTLALLVSGAGGAATPPALDTTTSLLSIAAVALFVGGFAPPLPLRRWWRRGASHQLQDLQATLIATSTPQDVAEAIAPMLAELLGGGVAVVGADGRVLAASQLDDETAHDVAARLRAGTELPEHTFSYPVGDAWLAVRSTAYTPVFGEQERELLATFSLHLQLALERAERYRAEQVALDEARAARDELESTLYGLSHDLKSPTVAIAGFVDLLPQADSDADREEMLRHIKASSTYLQQLVDALLELSRIGRVETDPVPVDLEATVREVGERVRVNHPRATVRIEGTLPTVSMNPVRATQLLDNLITNAVRHGGRQDIEVVVSAQQVGDWLELTVADDGQGIPEQDRQRIFDLFQRGSTSGARGSGVGLGMVRRIAEAAGGSVRLAESTLGARFVVRLPADTVLVVPTPPA